MQQQTKPLCIAITAGEPAGIGPDIVLQIASQSFAAELVVIASKTLLLERARQLQIPLKIHDFATKQYCPPENNQLWVLDVPLNHPCLPQKLDKLNSSYVIETLRLAGQGCLDGKFDAVVTAPVHKAIINEAGISFTGHTEFFAEFAKVPQVVMMLVAGTMRVALVTTHLPVAKVPAAITAEKLEQVIEILHYALRIQFKIPNPKILVAGLNPHAGESGKLGKEEINIIQPTLEKLRRHGMDLEGPLPADTLFLPQHLKTADAFLTMYHDQGLPVLKFYNFAEAVNITLGLPFIRTSVDHGTALELAGTGKADATSLLAAIKMAIYLAQNKVLQ